MSASADYIVPQRHDREPVARPDDSGAPQPLPNRSVSESPKSKPPRVGLLIFIVAIVLAAGFVIGLVPRLRERRIVVQDTKDLAQPNVAVVSPAPAKAGSPLVLSGELKPITEAYQRPVEES